MAPEITSDLYPGSGYAIVYYRLDERPSMTQLAAARDRLVRHNDALFRPTHGWGESIHGLRVASLGFSADAKSTVRINPAVFTSWDRTTLSQLEDEIDELGRLGALSGEWQTAPGWRPAAITGAAVAEGLRQGALELRWTHLPELRSRFGEEAGGLPNGLRRAFARLARAVVPLTLTA